MTGPEHYREAERLLNDKPTVSDWQLTPEDAAEHMRSTLAEAQVHATLALAAATVATHESGEDRDGVPFYTVADAAWIEATS